MLLGLVVKTCNVYLRQRIDTKGSSKPSVFSDEQGKYCTYWLIENIVNVLLIHELVSLYNSVQSARSTINYVDIERVYQTTFLGIIVDDRPSWKAHIQSVKSKLTKPVSIIDRSRRLINVSSRVT